MAFAKRDIRKLARAQMGNVKIQAAKSSKTILGLVEPFLQRPIPISAQVFACVVAVGIPKNEQTPRKDDEAVSAALLLRGSRAVISQPTFFIIFDPPIKVPSDIARAQARVTVIGMLNSLVSDERALPFMNEIPNIYTPINFCES